MSVLNHGAIIFGKFSKILRNEPQALETENWHLAENSLRPVFGKPRFISSKIKDRSLKWNPYKEGRMAETSQDGSSDKFKAKVDGEC